MIQKKNGYTLVELLASITILTLVIGAFIPIFIQITEWTNKSEDNLVGANLLAEVANELKNNPEAIANQEIASCRDHFSLIHPYDSYELNGRKYNVNLQICQEELVSLYRTKIEVFSQDNLLIGESYTYIQR